MGVCSLHLFPSNKGRTRFKEESQKESRLENQKEKMESEVTCEK